MKEVIEEYDNRTWLTIIIYKPLAGKHIIPSLLDLCDYYTILYHDQKDYLHIFLILQRDYEHFHDFVDDIPITYTIQS